MSVFRYNYGIEFVQDVRFTHEGGLARLFINKTGVNSVVGNLVAASTTLDNAVITTGASAPMPIGAIYNGGVPDGGLVWVIVSGTADVLLKDTTASTHGNWVYTSDTGGRADATLAAPPGGGIPELDQHMREIGHALESKTAGTNVLCRILMHFN